MNISAQRRRLSGQTFRGEKYAGQDLRGAIALGATFEDCEFKDCKFGQAQLQNATFEGCRLYDCNFDQAVLVCRILGCHFERCSFDQAVFAAAHIKDSKFYEGRAQYADFSRATVENTVLSLDLHGARLDFAESNHVSFAGSNLWGAVVPLGCAFFVGNEFDGRQLAYLLALVRLSEGNSEAREILKQLVPERIERVVQRIAVPHSAESAETRNT